MLTNALQMHAGLALLGYTKTSKTQMAPVVSRMLPLSPDEQWSNLQARIEHFANHAVSNEVFAFDGFMERNIVI